MLGEPDYDGDSVYNFATDIAAVMAGYMSVREAR